MRHVAFKATHVRPHFTRETESLLFRTGLEPGFPNNCDHLFTPSLHIPRLMASIRTATCARLRNTTLLKRACSSFRAAGLTGRRVVGPHKVRRPVRLPRAVVIRERLLPMGMIAVELIPRVADFHGATIVLVLAVEGAVIAVEAPGHRRFQPPTGATYPIDRPLALFQIERAQCQSCPALRREVEFIHRRHAAEVGSHAQSGGENFPLCPPPPPRLLTAPARCPPPPQRGQIPNAPPPPRPPTPGR